ncbi:GLPGLI family protein [Daejeonella sp.]|uniref:GLPGLI family protein n=1 Tax=Daejeonella sp. TaxID=2805397 RepID=UPI0030BFB3A7
MKRFILSCTALLVSFTAFAQNPDKALIRVLYTFNHIQDTMNRDKPRMENMLLVAGKNASVYTSYDKINQSANALKQIQEQIKNSGGGPMQIKIDKSSSRPITRTDNYFFAKENKFITIENLFNNYLIEETAPQIDWKILKDTMSFSGILCQKATAHFKGRNWIGWYAPDMPFQSGPWKLNGLPGLIIEAYDDKKEVQFLFAGTEQPGAAAEKAAAAGNITGPSGGPIMLGGMDNNIYSGSDVKLPADGIKTTQKAFDKLKETRDKDPQGFMKAQMAARGINTANISIRQGTPPPGASGPAGAPRPAGVINNPIELPERK